ncbi:MAG: TIGR00730 family Rossman fold protein [Alphaproteobacteria bacterium]|nr:TIGR00730 family Rossman fold protein [Alphaproteobacteria bacterium]MBR5566494.1 TIGR00730 family Rossman fold protein [Alphaproteobacteria bacterium]
MAGKLKSIAVYCGHQFGNDPKFKQDAIAVGAMLAQHGIRMVFGGGDVGLMGAVATSALDNGGVVIGVSTDEVVARQEPAHAEVDVHIVNGVNERKQRMFELSDAFIILAGGIGTLNELTDIMTMQQIGETNKPLFFLNTNNFWGALSELVRHMMDSGFVESLDDYRMYNADTVAELTEQILSY